MPKSNASKIQKLMANSFLVLISMIVTFLVCELAYRQISKRQAYSWISQVTDLSHRPRPYVAAVASNSAHGINSLGYKGKLPSMPKPPGEFRIIFLGGSTVFGLWPEEEEGSGFLALPEYVEQALKKQKGDHVQVYNFGIASTVAQQELARLIMDVVSFSPDLVVSYGGGNDLLPTGYDTRPGYPHRYLFQELNPLWITDVEQYPAIRLLAFGSLLFRDLFRNQFESWLYSMREPEFYKAKGVKYYEDIGHNYSESLSRMQKVSRAFDSEFVAYFQPLKAFYHPGQSFFPDSLEGAQKMIQLVRAIPDLKFRFLHEEFKSEPLEVWVDEIHLEDDANQRISRIVAEDLLQYIPDK